MKKILLGIIILFLITSFGYCQEFKLDKETISVCNQAMENIYKDILKIKDKYNELEGFDKSVLQKGGIDGVNSISYSYNLEHLSKTPGRSKYGDNAFRFYLSITHINEVWQAMNSFEQLAYPNLRIKFYGWFVQPQPDRKPKHIKSDLTKDISEIVHKNVKALSELDRKKSPFQLTIKSDKEVYEVGEEIKIQLEVANISSQSVIFNSRCYGAKLQIQGPNNTPIFGKEYKLKVSPPREENFIIIPKGKRWNSGFITISPYKEGFERFPYLEGAYNITEIGKYKITALYSNYYTETGERKRIDAWIGTLTSNTITIEVAEKSALQGSKITSQNTESLCKELLLNICNDIEKIKSKFSELSNFGPNNPIIFGNLIPPSDRQLERLRLIYQYNAEYIQGADAPSRVFLPKEGGCVLWVELFPEGDSWGGFMDRRPDLRIFDVFYDKSGVRIQGFINCRNEKLAETLEKIIRNRIVDLQ